VIRPALLGVARILFSFAALTAILAAGLLYTSYRLVRAAYNGAPAPKRDAGFALLLAAVMFGKALAADRQLPERTEADADRRPVE
jgi:hypothetical protein